MVIGNCLINTIAVGSNEELFIVTRWNMLSLHFIDYYITVHDSTTMTTIYACYTKKILPSLNAK